MWTESIFYLKKELFGNEEGCFQHPWQGKRVGYIGDSITDPNCYGKEIKNTGIS